MSLTDPIANMLTSIRNANMHHAPVAYAPASKLKKGVLEVLKREGFIVDFEVVEEKPQNKFKIELKYGPTGERVINEIKRVSKPGCRVYKGKETLKPVKNGFGIDVVSTSKGIMSDRECRKEQIGGELLCTVN